MRQDVGINNLNIGFFLVSKGVIISKRTLKKNLSPSKPKNVIHKERNTAKNNNKAIK